MQFSLPETIDQLFEALIEPDGLHHISNEQLLHFRTCVRHIGMDPHMLHHDHGITSMDAAEATQLRHQLKQAKAALKALSASLPADTFLQIDEFAAGTLSMVGVTSACPELDSLLSGMQMMAVKRTASGRYDALHTTLTTRAQALDAIELIRPDIASVMRRKVEEKQLGLNEAGELPATPVQIRDLAKSYRTVIDSFATSAEEAQSTIEAIRAESQPKLKVIKTIHEGGIVKQKGAHGHEAVSISTRPREESTEHFMVDLDIMQPALDLAKSLNELRQHPSGQDAKYLSSKGKFLVRCMDTDQAHQWQQMLQKLIKVDQGIGIEIDDSTNRKHPSIWLTIPLDLLDKIRAESAWLHDLRDEVRATFDRGDKEGAQKLKDDLIDYATPRIHGGTHAAAVAESRANTTSMAPGK